MDVSELIRTVAIYALPVVFAITVHEAAHGYVARYFGDPTAWQLGRVTLNPISHIDPLGTLVMPLLLYFATSGGFVFGYAKPVPVNFGQLRRPKQHMVWVALAGPASNFIQALAWGAALVLLGSMDVREPFFLKMCQAGVLVNVVMCVFNLFPLPPLDGGRILVGLLPWRPAQLLARVEPWGFFIVLGLMLTGVVTALWMRPLMGLSYDTLALLLKPLAWAVGR
jgi:Zn-dependent protease